MRFYDMLQLDPGTLKKKIRSAELPKERHKLTAAMIARTILIVIFAIIMISPVANVFGPENSPMGVALFCILLGIRFVDFGYRIQDSMINFAVVLLLLVFAPVAAAHVNVVLSMLIHISAFFLILFMTSDRPELGNSGLYTFAYIYLSGNPVTGVLLGKRLALAFVGYVLCGAILFAKHRKNNQDVRFVDKVKQFRLADKKMQWLLQLAMGVGIMLALGTALHLPRMMWAAFACGSIVGCYSAGAVEARKRAVQRFLGVLIGSAIFFVFYPMVPESVQSLFGPLGGLCLGLCTKYRYQTACNCLGALFMATSLYGVQESVVLRISQNFVGLIFGVVFLVAFQKVMSMCFSTKNSENPLPQAE